MRTEYIKECEICKEKGDEYKVTGTFEKGVIEQVKLHKKIKHGEDKP